jgi:hypothetical protein
VDKKSTVVMRRVLTARRFSKPWKKCGGEFPRPGNRPVASVVKKIPSCE